MRCIITFIYLSNIDPKLLIKMLSNVDTLLLKNFFSNVKTGNVAKYRS